MYGTEKGKGGLLLAIIEASAQKFVAKVCFRVWMALLTFPEAEVSMQNGDVTLFLTSLTELKNYFQY